jgi:hypothetical protein
LYTRIIQRAITVKSEGDYAEWTDLLTLRYAGFDMSDEIRPHEPWLEYVIRSYGEGLEQCWNGHRAVTAEAVAIELRGRHQHRLNQSKLVGGDGLDVTGDVMRMLRFETTPLELIRDYKAIAPHADTAAFKRDLDAAYAAAQQRREIEALL